MESRTFWQRLVTGPGVHWSRIALMGVIGGAGAWVVFSGRQPLWNVALPVPQISIFAAARPISATRQEAKRILKETLLADPHNPSAWRAIGQLALDNGDSRRAVEYLATATDQAPDDWAAWYSLSRAYQRRGAAGDSQRARDATERAAHLRNAAMQLRDLCDRAMLLPSDTDAQRAAAHICLAQSHRDKAAYFLARYIERRPNDQCARREWVDLERERAEERAIRR